MKWALGLLALLAIAACSSPAQEASDRSVEHYEPSPPPPPPPAPPPSILEEVIVEEGAPVTRSRRIEDRGSSVGYSYAPPPAAPETSIEDVASQLSTASFAYSWPDKVNIRDRFDVDLMINPSLLESEIREEISGEVIAAGTVRISRILIARLTAPDFEIEALTPDRQALDARETTRWKWRLEPRSAGSDREITISVIAVIEVGEDRAERFLKTFEGAIEVDVTPTQRVEDWISANWQWAWSALLIPVAGWAYARRRRRNKEGD